MRIAVIGAGSAGLAAIKRCTEGASQDEVVCYERSDQIGGIWVYSPETGVDKFGLPLHSTMYKSLRTNLPKEVMGYPDFPIPENPRSYLKHTEILEFLNLYCEHFRLRKYIRFQHNVESVEPCEKGNKWLIKVRDLPNDTVTNEIFDAVLVCNGHYSQAFTPELKGQNNFRGLQLHSRDYRVPDGFIGKTVVVIGAGPSGMDLALEISRLAKRVILSHHFKEKILTKFPENLVQKGDVAELTENEAIFVDGTREPVDVIFYCTGYHYSFPFLSTNCGVRVDSNMVTPLWKHVISIEHPTLALIGLPFYVCAFNMFDLQVRFVLRYWRGEKKLPSKEEMLEEEKREFQEKLQQGLGKKQFHMMGYEQGRYYQDLADTADVAPLPPVFAKLHNESSARFLDNLTHYREDRYKIIDENTFVQL